MKDVASVAGVSVGTVSNVLNSPEIVAPATRQRVLDAIERLGWVPSEAARQLRSGRNRSIGMIVMDIGNPFFADILNGVEDSLHARSYSVHLGNSALDPSKELNHILLFEQQRIGGLLLAPTSGLPSQIEKTRMRGIPVVLVDRIADGDGYCAVAVDDLAGGAMAANHLIDRGHRHIAFVGGPPGLAQVRDRRTGAERAMLSRQGPGMRFTVHETERLDVTSGVKAAQEIGSIPRDERPTAVFTANDMVAIGVLQGFVMQGLVVPDDIAIMGYDDIAFAEASAVPLSSVRQPRWDIGAKATELLFDEIAAAESEQPHQHRQVRFTPSVVPRRSTEGQR
jgi:LacI family transcriptional regulator